MKRLYNTGHYIIADFGTGLVTEYSMTKSSYTLENGYYKVKESIDVGTLIILIADIGDWYDETGLIAYTEATLVTFLRTFTSVPTMYLSTINGVAPQFTANPTTTGTAVVDNVLSGTDGTWTGTEPITYTYQWQESTDGIIFSNKIGETNANYTVVAGDSEKYIRRNVIADNGFGSPVTALSSNHLFVFYVLDAQYSLTWAVDTDNMLVSGTSTTLYDYFSVDDMVNPTAGQQPELIQNAYGEYSTLRFIIGKLLKKTVANWRAGDATGQITYVFKSNVDGFNNIWGTADQATTKTIWTRQNDLNRAGYVNNGGNSGGGNLTGDAFLNTTTTYVITFLQDGTTGKIYISNLEDEITTNTIGLTWLNDLPTQRDNITLGGYQNTGTGNSRSDITFACYGSDTSDATIKKIHSALINKYDIAIYNLVVDGDSIDFGTGASFFPTFNTKLDGDSVPRLLINKAISGQQLGGPSPNMLTRYSPETRYNSKAQKNIILMGGGTNDICSFITQGRTVTDLYNDFLTYYNYMTALGYTVIPRTILPRSNVTCVNLINFESDRQAYNTLIKSFCTANSVILCNAGDDPTIGVFGASDNTTYYNGDKVHLKQAGADILGNLYGDAVLAVLAAL